MSNTVSSGELSEGKETRERGSVGVDRAMNGRKERGDKKGDER